jgi:class 3 adenylate cyclase
VRRTSIGLVADDVASGTWHPGAAGETVTILFSDIEGSTRCASALGDSVWFELLDAHNRIVRSELPVTGGREVKSQGDGFMLAFASARRALDFAARTQRRVTAELAHVRGGPVRVRMGLHTGESVADATGDLFGRHVNKAARIADLAGGGQVLVSSTVREIAEGTLDAAFDQGVEVELRGLPGTHVLHRFSW